jgi:hypothetical protein
MKGADGQSFGTPGEISGIANGTKPKNMMDDEFSEFHD